MSPQRREGLARTEQAQVLAIAELGLGRSLDEALQHARYRELRARFVAEDLLPLLEAEPALAARWIAFAEARGEESEWGVSRVGELWPRGARERAVRYGQPLRAIAHYVVNELDAVETRLRGAPETPWPMEPWPFDQPIYRRSFRLRSPDGSREAAIEVAHEVAMSAPTSGTLALSTGEHLTGCNPSFLWSDDGRWLVVPCWFHRWGLLRRQRLTLLDVVARRCLRSRVTAAWFQPEDFSDGTLRVRVAPWSAERWLSLEVPEAFEVCRRSPFGAAVR